MPELPEVETVLRILEQQLQDHKIVDIEVPYPKLLHQVAVADFKAKLIGKTWQSFDRRGKYLCFRIDDQQLYCHLRMEGKFYFYDKTESFERKHVHLIFYLDDGRLLCYHDTRKFGRFYLYEQNEIPECLADLGYEPWDQNLDAKRFYQMLHQRKVALKDFLLDQRYVTGIGNIYANEACFAAKLYPYMLTNTITRKDSEELLKQIRRILENAIASGGTSIRTYTASLGVTGRFQLHLYVYQRAGKPCLVCQSPIVKQMFKGRGTFYCKTCQRKGAPK